MDSSRSFLALAAGRRAKWGVLAVWVAVAAVAFPLAGKVGEVEENDAAAWLPRSAESTEVVALQPGFFGNETLPAVVVYARAGGITDEDRVAVEADRQALAGLVPGGQLPPAVPSADGAALLLTIPLVPDAEDDELIFEQIDRIKAVVGEGEPAGLEAKVTGPAGGLADAVAVFEDIDGLLLGATVAVVALLLLLISRSPLL